MVEIISPDDETYEKFGLYATRGVEEIVVADPAARSVTVWQRASDTGYEMASASSLLGISVADLGAAISWPEDSD